MNRKYTKTFYFCMLLFILFLLPTNVQAQLAIANTGTIVNKNLDIKLPKTISGTKVNLYNSSIEYCNTLTDLKSSILNHMYNRDTTFTLEYGGNFSNLKSDISKTLNDIDSSDYYLSLSYSSMDWTGSGNDGNIKITFNFTYLTTKDEEAYVNNRVTTILNSLITKAMNDDDKEKAIHDYIVKNVTYDTSLKYYSAYDALAYGTTVCQGYSLLAYKMLKEAGIDTKIVTGTAGGDVHAWNLVKIRNNWYHLDCTWDDPIPDTGSVNYDYYNINDLQMSLDHTWEKSNYPAADSTYIYSSGNTGVHMTNIKLNHPYLNLEIGQSYKLQTEILPTDTSNKNVMWYTSDANVVSVDTDGNLKAVAVGDAVITVKSEDGGLFDLCKVNVGQNFDINLDNYKKWPEKNNITLNKVWTITFKSNIDSYSVNYNNIYMLDDTLENKIDVNIQILGNKILVTSKNGYKAGHTYYLIIGKTVSSTNGYNLACPVVMKFNTILNP